MLPNCVAKLNHSRPPPDCAAFLCRDFTLLGRPVLPRDLVRVEATVVEKNLSKTEVRLNCLL